jgi:hypothetical protein
LEDLKRRGDPQLLQFTVPNEDATACRSVRLSLNKVDRRVKYVTVFVDDRTIEKRDKTAGEPVQFL